ncbi:hypothetical protein C8F01DRAFT_320367 [Mycena amicta]|nr:hypothetical protein C8F01DRAFT_320367 [Mycena amicta]
MSMDDRPSRSCYSRGSQISCVPRAPVARRHRGPAHRQLLHCCRSINVFLRRFIIHPFLVILLPSSSIRLPARCFPTPCSGVGSCRGGAPQWSDLIVASIRITGRMNHGEPATWSRSFPVPKLPESSHSHKTDEQDCPSSEFRMQGLLGKDARHS